MAPRVRPITDFVYEMGHGDSASPLWHSLAAMADSESLTNPTSFTLFTNYFTLPGGTLTVGRVLTVTAWGPASLNSGSTVGVKMRIGSQAFFEGTTAVAVSSGSNVWHATGMLIPYVAGASGFFRSSGFAIIANQAVSTVFAATAGTINTTADNVIDISIVAATNDPGNQLGLDGMTVSLSVPGTLI